MDVCGKSKNPSVGKYEINVQYKSKLSKQAMEVVSYRKVLQLQGPLSRDKVDQTFQTPNFGKS